MAAQMSASRLPTAKMSLMDYSRPSLRSMLMQRKSAGQQDFQSTAADESFVRAPAQQQDIPAGESFSHLKLTAEKMMQEQACARSDLQLLQTKLQKAEEQIQQLEAKLQHTSGENAKLKAKQNEDLKLWQGLEAKYLPTKSMCDQLMDSVNQLEQQVRDAESCKAQLEGKLAERYVFYDTVKTSITELSDANRSLKEEIDQVHRYDEELKNDIEKLRQEHSLQKEDLEAMTQEIRQKEDEKTKLQHQMQDQVVTVRAECQQQLEEMSKSHQEELSNLKADYEAREAAIHKEADVKQHELQAATEAAHEDLAKHRAATVLQLESKEADLQKFLEELSARNNQELLDMRQNFESNERNLKAAEESKTAAALSERDAALRQIEALQDHLLQAKSAADKESKERMEKDEKALAEQQLLAKALSAKDAAEATVKELQELVYVSTTAKNAAEAKVKSLQELVYVSTATAEHRQNNDDEIRAMTRRHCRTIDAVPTKEESLHSSKQQQEDLVLLKAMPKRKQTAETMPFRQGSQRASKQQQEECVVLKGMPKRKQAKRTRTVASRRVSPKRLAGQAARLSRTRGARGLGNLFGSEDLDIYDEDDPYAF
eukprot:SM000009S23575  [mRNA]  locus=s9:791137:793557:+ [translate_table: standard]